MDSTKKSEDKTKDAEDNEVREKLRGEVDLAPWQALRSHAEAERLFLAASDLDLVEIGLALARDQSAPVNAWIAAGQLARPTPPQLAAWDETDEQIFRCLIVAPFVLAQET
ncbi:MAG: DUF2288 family protein [Myxococcota bacterium]|jgi:hypothetical protein|nr:DUF2288 family protein [Myxococcota bacterium]